MTESAYKLADNAFACVADDRLVFSDIRQDRYRCLDRSNTRAALEVLQRFPGSDAGQQHKLPTASAQQAGVVFGALRRAGLILIGENGGKAFVPVCIPTPCEELDKNRTDARLRPGHWLSFCRATTTASARLRLQSFHRILRDVEKRKRIHAVLDPRPGNEMLDLVSVFHRLRPFYVRGYLCRFDSLALVEFLAYYRQFPDWVFGVTGEPFNAHCWVQSGDYVLNDSVDFIRRFTPIMAF